MNKKLLLAAAAAAITVAGTAAAPALAAKDVEKCYGVVKAGKNDCANKAGTHSCAGLASKDSDAGEWIYTPKGLCDRLTNGTTGESKS